MQSLPVALGRRPTNYMTALWVISTRMEVDRDQKNHASISEAEVLGLDNHMGNDISG